jgi:hypothetical protein
LRVRKTELADTFEFRHEAEMLGGRCCQVNCGRRKKRFTTEDTEFAEKEETKEKDKEGKSRSLTSFGMTVCGTYVTTRLRQNYEVVDGWSGRSCGVQLGVTIRRDSGEVLRVATGCSFTGLGLLRRASEKLLELDFEASRARVLGVRAVYFFG